MPRKSPSQDLRLFVRPSDLLVVPFDGRLQRPGPGGAAVERLLARRVAVADLERVEEDELAVAFLHGSRCDAHVRERIRDWAELVGFRRLWLPGVLVQLDPAGREIGDVRTRCTACSATFSDGGADFWAMVRRRKLFPDRCPVCAGALPQWRLRSTRLHAVRPAGDATHPGVADGAGAERPQLR